jgi:hypothetical protein
MRFFYITKRCFHKTLYDLTKRDKAVQWLCCRLNDRETGVRFLASVRDFSLLQNFHYGPGTWTASSSRVLVFLLRLQIRQAVKLLIQLHRTPRMRLWKCNSIPLTSLFRPVKEVKESRNRPGVFQRVPGGLGSQISWHSARESGEVVSLTHRPHLLPGMFLVLIFTRGWLRSEGNMSLKNPVTPPRMDPGTLRLAA